MQVSQNVVRALHSDPTFKPDKDSVVEQLMGQIRNMEDTISSVLVALEYGPDMGTIYRLNQAASTLKISGRKEKVKGKSQDTSETTVELRANLKGVDDPDFAEIISSLTMEDIKSLRLCSRWMKERVDLHFKNFLILIARSEEDILEMKKFHLEPENRGYLTNTGLLQLLAKCSATLEHLNLNGTDISGEDLESVPVLKQLETLNLGSCPNVTNTGLLQLLAKCTDTLKELNLEGFWIKGFSIAVPDLKLYSVPVLKQLETLNLNGCGYLEYTDLLQFLAKCSATLEQLNLNSTAISGEDLESVPVLKQLKTLNLGGCRYLTNTGLLQLLAKCTATLESLNLSNTGITGEGLDSVPVLKLEKLDLNGCGHLEDTGLLQLLAKCSASLKDMNLGSTRISGEGLESVPVLKLEKLDLNWCRKLTNTGLLELLAKCTATLESLNLDSTDITGEGLKSVPVLEQLETLNLHYCDQLTNAGLLQLLAKCSATLKDMYLGKTGISGEGLES